MQNLTRRQFNAMAGFGALAGILGGCGGNGGSGNPRSSVKPDIVLIMADDMGFSDIGCYGSEIETPVLDRLAANGLRFTQFYNTARCCPTRAALMTGLYQHQANMGHMTYDTGIPHYGGDLGRDCVTIAEALKPAGYRCYMHGKWHLTTHYGEWYGDGEYSSKHNWPLQRGFDRFYGIIDGTSNFFQPFSLVRDNEPEPVDPDPDYYLTDAISNHAVRCIEETPAGTPFFSYVAYTAPHFPLHAPVEDVARMKGRYDAGWDEIRRTRYTRMVELGIVDPAWGLSDRDETVGPFEDEEYEAYRKRAMEVYAAMIERMDRGIGRIVEALERTGRLENTVILFLSDNGAQAGELAKGQQIKRFTPQYARDGRPMHAGNDPEIMPGPEDTWQSYGSGWANLSNTPFRKFKGNIYEGGISTPLVVHWPAGIAARGELRGQVGHVMDIMPTCCELAGADYPAKYAGTAIQPCEGISLLPAFAGKPVERGPLFWEHEGKRAVLMGNWKLVGPANGGWELYDIVADRTERHDRAADYPAKVAELEALYDAWASRCGVMPWNDFAAERAAAGKRVDDLTIEYRATHGKPGMDPIYFRD